MIEEGNNETLLDAMLESLAEEDMPVTLRNAILKNVEAETVRRSRSVMRMERLSVAAATAGIIALAAFGMIRLGISVDSIRLPDLNMPGLGLYAYVGILALILLGLDYLLRHRHPHTYGK
jgi:hypothetical protein